LLVLSQTVNDVVRGLKPAVSLARKWC